jgi:hypothetical protein
MLLGRSFFWSCLAQDDAMLGRNDACMLPKAPAPPVNPFQGPGVGAGASSARRLSCGLIHFGGLNVVRTTESRSLSQHIAQKNVRLLLWYDACAPGPSLWLDWLRVAG